MTSGADASGGPGEHRVGARREARAFRPASAESGWSPESATCFHAAVKNEKAAGENGSGGEAVDRYVSGDGGPHENPSDADAAGGNAPDADATDENGSQADAPGTDALTANAPGADAPAESTPGTDAPAESASGADVLPGDPDRHVRPRTGGDLGGCVRVLAEVHACDGYPVNWPERPDEWLSPPSLVASWVVEQGGRIAGHVGLSRSDADDAAPGLWSARTGTGADRIAVISRLFVAPSARGQGIGATLLTRAASEARERGLHPVLDVVASDTAAAALYERLGWRLLATVEQRWGPDQTVAVRCYAAAP